MKCPICDGCGKVANTEDREPWSDWESLPETAKLSIRMGLVKPITCYNCVGTGEVDELQDN